MSKNLPLRPNVSIILINKLHQVLLGERFGQPNIWQFPQGGVEENSSLEENVYREIQEEIGLTKKEVKIIKKLDLVNDYEWSVTPDFYKGKYRGQSQTFWLVKVLDDTSKFILDNTHQEFGQVKWTDINSVLDIVEPARKSGYQKAIIELQAYLENNSI